MRNVREHDMQEHPAEASELTVHLIPLTTAVANTTFSQKDPASQPQDRPPSIVRNVWFAYIMNRIS